MFHQLMIEQEIEAEGGSSHVDKCPANVGDDEEANELPQWILGRPVVRINVRREQPLVREVEHDIHVFGLKVD